MIWAIVIWAIVIWAIVIIANIVIWAIAIIATFHVVSDYRDNLKKLMKSNAMFIDFVHLFASLYTYFFKMMYFVLFSFLLQPQSWYFRDFS